MSKSRPQSVSKPVSTSSPSNPGRRGRPPHDDILTPAEWRTVHAVRHGLTNPQIAARRGISVDAVKFHVANAIAKLGLEKRKDLRRWIGAPKESPMNQTHAAESPIPVRGLGQVSRSVRDVQESETWYRDVLKLDHLYTFDKLAFFDCGGTRLMLNQGDEVNPSESMLYLQVDDIQATHRDLEQRGVEFISPPHMIHQHEDGTEEWMAFFKDPEGRPLALMATAQARD